MRAHFKKPRSLKRERRSALREGFKYTVAVGTLAACATVGTESPATLARAQESATGAVTAAQGTLPTRRFDIPAGPLGDALIQFQQATGMQVRFAEQGIRELNSPGASGVYTDEDALRRLLAGTGADFEAAAGGYRISLRELRISVDVNETAIPVSSPKYTEPIRDLPQTITVVPRMIIEQQGATTLTDVLRNVPGLTIAAGEGGAPAGDNLTLRGFSARNDIFVDGVRDLGPQSRDSFNLEQVEVVKGPQSAYTGRGSTGGSINLVSKAPSQRKAIGFNASLGNADLRRFGVDLNTPLSRAGLGERTALRLNLLYHDAGIPGRDVVKNSRWGVAPSLSFGLGTPTRLTLSYYKLKQDNISDYGIPWVPATNNALAAYRNQPAPVPRETFYGFRDRDRELMNSDMGTVRFEHDFSDGVVFQNQFRYGRSTRDSIATPPRFADTDSTVINREMRSWITEDTVYDNQTNLTAEFGSGPVRHSLVTGTAFTKEGNIRRIRTAPNAQTTLLNPNPDDVYTGQFTYGDITGDLGADTQSVYGFDTLKLGQHWQVTGGLRLDRFSANGITTNGDQLARTDTMLNSRASAVYKPVEAGSFYFGFGSSMNPSLEGLSYQPADATTAPERSYTFEGGTKWDLFHRRLLLTAALFRSDKSNARTPGVNPDDPPTVLDGVQRVNGVEFGATGYLTPSWSIFGNVTLMSSKVVASNDAGQVGNTFPLTPTRAGSLWSTYQVGRVTAGGGVRYTGARYNNLNNARRADGYWTADAMASLAVNSHLDLRLNLYNLSNAYYFERVGGGHVIPGPARAVMVSTAFHF